MKHKNVHLIAFYFKNPNLKLPTKSCCHNTILILPPSQETYILAQSVLFERARLCSFIVFVTIPFVLVFSFSFWVALWEHFAKKNLDPLFFLYCITLWTCNSHSYNDWLKVHFPTLFKKKRKKKIKKKLFKNEAKLKFPFKVFPNTHHKSIMK